MLISTSKIKNNSAIKKNWKEKGMCEGVMRLNPHSNFVHLLADPASFFFTIMQDKDRMDRKKATAHQIMTSFIVKILCLFIIQVLMEY